MSNTNTAEMATESLTLEQLRAERDALNAKVKELQAKEAAQDRNTFRVYVAETVNETDSKGRVIRENGKPKTRPGKGTVSVAGLGTRFPVSLYPEQWEVLFSHKDQILESCEKNKALIAKLRAQSA